MRILMLAGLLLGATGAQAQVIDWVSVLTLDAGNGTKYAEARCFAFQGPPLGEQCPGFDWPLPAFAAGEPAPPVWFLWDVERCSTTAGCVAVNFHQTTYPWRIITPAMSGPALYRIRVYLPMSGYIWGEAAFRVGKIDPLASVRR